MILLGGKCNTIHCRDACVEQKVFDHGDINFKSMKMLNEDKTTFNIDKTVILSVNSAAVLGKLPIPRMLTDGNRMKY